MKKIERPEPGTEATLQDLADIVPQLIDWQHEMVDKIERIGEMINCVDLAYDEECEKLEDEVQALRSRVEELESKAHDRSPYTSFARIYQELLDRVEELEKQAEPKPYHKVSEQFGRLRSPIVCDICGKERCTDQGGCLDKPKPHLCGYDNGGGSCSVCKPSQKECEHTSLIGSISTGYDCTQCPKKFPPFHVPYPPPVHELDPGIGQY